MSKHEMTWKQFDKVYGVGVTEHVSYDTRIKIGRFGPKMVSNLSDKERNTFYTFNVYNLETDKDVFTYEYHIETMEEILEIIASEFNIAD